MKLKAMSFDLPEREVEDFAFVRDSSQPPQWKKLVSPNSLMNSPHRILQDSIVASLREV